MWCVAVSQCCNNFKRLSQWRAGINCECWDDTEGCCPNTKPFYCDIFLILHFNCGFDSTVLRRKVTPCKKKGVPKWALCVVCTTNKVLLWLTAGVIVSWWLWLHQMPIYIDKTYIYIPYISLLGMALYHSLFQMYSRESVGSLWLLNRW